jgi:hypothetical protein
MPYAQTKEHAHELLDRMAPGQLSAVVGLMEMILDPVARSLANAPWEDEEIDEDEERAVAESKAWLAANPGKGTPHEDVLAEFGFTAEDAERMARTPPEPNGAAR